MRNVSIRIAGCLFVLTILVWSLACGPSAPNSNQVQNQNTPLDPANSNAGVAGITDGSCNETDLNRKLTRVKENVRAQIEAREELERQLNGQGPQRPSRFKIDAGIVDNYIVVFVEGRIEGEDELEWLVEVLNNFKKDRCVLKVRLVPPGTLPITPQNLSAGFEWSLCEWPSYPCPDGTCKESCQKNINANTNGNANSNVNANVNQNMNANSSNMNK
jgi:hypothetical protein